MLVYFVFRLGNFPAYGNECVGHICETGIFVIIVARAVCFLVGIAQFCTITYLSMNVLRNQIETTVNVCLFRKILQLFVACTKLTIYVQQWLTIILLHIYISND